MRAKGTRICRARQSNTRWPRLFGRKKLTAALLAVLLAIFSLPVPAAFAAGTGNGTAGPQIGLFNPAGLEGGIANETVYREIVWVTGEPVEVSGTLKFSASSARGGKATIKCTYQLENAARGIDLKRSLTLEAAETASGRQIIYTAYVKSASETITVSQAGSKNKTTFRLVKDGYQFSYSAVLDQQPAVGYFSSNWIGRKTYEINKGEGTLTVDLSGEGVGYSHAWGEAETRSVQISLAAEPSGNSEQPAWNGAASLSLAFNCTRDLTYVPNEPAVISFAGGYVKTETRESILDYSYDLPLTPGKSERTEGSGRIKLNAVPLCERLPVAGLKDVRGFWAEDEIGRMVSLGALRGGEYFGARLPLSRAEFARGLAQVGGISALPGSAPGSAGASGKTAVAGNSAPFFSDLPASHPDGPYVLALVQQGVMQGVGGTRFNPEGTLTRAQAATAIVRMLGLQGMAPNFPYRTSFADDRDIPAWARDAVYVAAQLNLLKGDPAGAFRPQDEITRAEGAVLLERLRSYLAHDLKYHYREQILYQR